MIFRRTKADWPRTACLFFLGVWPLALVAPLATAQDVDTAAPQRQSRDDAWWTGPMLANSAETLTPGHMLVEPYVYDAMSHKKDAFGSRAYVLYGVTDDFTVGFIPIVGYNRVSGGPNSSGIGLGDQMLQAQYRLIRYHEGSWVPTVSLMLQQSLPTGNYDRLGSRPANGMGGGAYATTLGVNAQTYFWMPNGRILRMRLNVTSTVSGHADIDGVSVYGTGPSFHGRAHPGDNFYVDTSFEYSLTTRWALATDVVYSHNDNTRVTGTDNPSGPLGLPLPVRINSGSSDTVGYAPAVEYNWTPNIGVLAGVRVLAGGHNTQRTVTPVIALNYVH
ncbi:transporter [Pinirhizobacter soli]|uniref:transporter n=1 Tax=Pinirhizobacter soli TaxID=2786953 RepID=UPI00202A916F|nr:transporter [Pinirhizobacter soli]